jgi:hypothetical protein
LAPPRQVRRRSDERESESRLDEDIAEVPAINMAKD